MHVNVPRLGNKRLAKSQGYMLKPTSSAA